MFSGMSQKKLTQTTLSFFVKSKSAKDSLKAASPSAPRKKRPIASQELKRDVGKKAKLLAVAKRNETVTDDGHISEPEVSSSSEQVQDTSASSNQNSQCTLEPFIHLTRCETPNKIEVTSSTGIDEVIEIPDSPLCEIIEERFIYPVKDNDTIGHRGTTIHAVEGKATSSQSAEGKASTSQSAVGKASCSQSAEGKAKSSQSAEGKATSSQSAAGKASTSRSAEGKASSSQPAEGKASSSQSPEGKANNSESPDGKAASSESDEGKATSSQSDEGKATSSQSDEGKATSSQSDEGKATSSQSTDNSSLEEKVDSHQLPTSESTTLPTVTDMCSPGLNDGSTVRSPRIKNLSLSAQRQRDKQRIAMEQKKKQKEEEREQKRLQKLEEKQRKEQELEEVKRIKAEQREAERLAKLKEKEEKQKVKEELQKQKQAALEAKNAQKEAERQQKEAERQQKEEVRLKKEEEKRQKELEKIREKEEKQRAIEAQQNVLARFFQKTPKRNVDEEPAAIKDAPSRFKPFTPNSDMRLACLHRVPRIDVEEFDKAFTDQSLMEHIYHAELESNGARSSPSTWPWVDDEICLVTDGKRHRAKFLQFHTDVRPAYFGTWQKKSKRVRSRRPFGQDKERFDYENDSADEWEEEEPGESVDSGEEEEEKDEFDFDPELREDGFLVDHNYLSDGEGGVSDDEETLAAKKTKQMIARTYGKGNRKKSKLKHVVYGMVWQDEESAVHAPHAQKLLAFSAIVFHSRPIEFTAPVKQSPTCTDASSAVKKFPQPVPGEAYPHLIKAVHGCTKGIKIIVETFRNSWEEKYSVILSKARLKATIQQVASYQKLANRGAWLVKEEYLAKYNLSDLPIPNPTYLKDTPAKPETPVIKATPNQPENDSNQKQGSNSSQKRMTEFLQPAKKRLKIDGTSIPIVSSPDVSLITLTDSPEVSCEASTCTATTSAAQEPSAQIITLTDSPVSSTENPVASGEVKKASPKRVQFTTIAPKIGTPTNKTIPTPRRVILTPVCATALPKAISPRRVALTTISTPRKTNEAKVEKVVTPTSSPQTSKSPRRVKFTTLSQPTSAMITTNTLTERSQNTPKPDPNSFQIKSSTTQ